LELPLLPCAPFRHDALFHAPVPSFLPPRSVAVRSMMPCRAALHHFAPSATLIDRLFPFPTAPLVLYVRTRLLSALDLRSIDRRWEVLPSLELLRFHCTRRERAQPDAALPSGAGASTLRVFIRILPSTSSILKSAECANRASSFPVFPSGAFENLALVPVATLTE